VFSVTDLASVKREKKGGQFRTKHNGANKYRPQTSVQSKPDEATERERKLQARSCDGSAVIPLAGYSKSLPPRRLDCLRNKTFQFEISRFAVRFLGFSVSSEVITFGAAIIRDLN